MAKVQSKKRTKAKVRKNILKVSRIFTPPSITRSLPLRTVTVMLLLGLPLVVRALGAAVKAHLAAQVPPARPPDVPRRNLA